jgi:hypothetical protein
MFNISNQSRVATVVASPPEGGEVADGQTDGWTDGRRDGLAGVDGGPTAMLTVTLIST